MGLLAVEGGGGKSFRDFRAIPLEERLQSRNQKALRSGGVESGSRKNSERFAAGGGLLEAKRKARGNVADEGGWGGCHWVESLKENVPKSWAVLNIY